LSIGSEEEIHAQIATFLAGISFASILLLYQFRSEINSITLFWLTGSLSFTVIFFTFSALSCTEKIPKGSWAIAYWGITFISGFVAFFISLYLLLALINQVIAIISVVLAVILFLVYLMPKK
jgi:tellurite resistance protein TehA-like permease